MPAPALLAVNRNTSDTNQHERGIPAERTTREKDDKGVKDANATRP
jgi:hypothetical protein